ncbi:class I SAM-dependent methyltransferase [Streptomyces albofaciens JCM 4342]|uniref:class I SAM-dependent methyltransferase n=1 Tax=Streptomyces albofaciens TaxID=66866 RepID=UPI001239A5CF|nr:class I SAM-dependent methyltransferase [Streptomyces albofaciens]KAA6222590.1 class I SAM-dependent methyltransferase [Streptomyces albofaciens JCM 4342]
METPRKTQGFWETTGAAKTFTHPLDPELLDTYVPRDVPVLDYGCGYGRLTAELVAAGYADVQGVDVSRALVERGAREHPEARLAHCPELPLPFEDASFGAALLFAVLTCVPEAATQKEIVGELGRLVRPGGVLYVSDVPLQSDRRNLTRYEDHASRYGTYGIFETPDGGVFRHSTPDHLRGLLETHGFTVETERSDTVPTMDGHTVERLQLVGRRR